MSAKLNNPALSKRWVTSVQVNSGTIADGSTTASFATPMRLPTRHATQIHLIVRSDQAVTVFIRRFSNASGISLDGSGTAVSANTTTGVVIDGATAAIGDEAELVVTNASGSTATITGTLWAR